MFKMKHIILLLLATILLLGFINISYSSISDKGIKEFKLGNNFYKKGDYKKAVYWYQKSAERGHDVAQFILAVSYFNGKGIAKDYKQAFHWFKKSAEQGNADAQYNLAQMYKNGIGVSKNDKQAFFWFRKHAEQGNDGDKSKVSIKETIISQMLEDNNCRKVTSTNYHVTSNVSNIIQGMADFECFDVLVPRGYFGVTTIRPISGNVNPDIRVFDLRTKRQVAIGEGSSEELESFNYKGEKRWYRVIVYDFTAKKGRHDFYIHFVSLSKFNKWLLEEDAKRGIKNAKKFLTITALLVGAYFTAKAIGLVFSSSGDDCLKSNCSYAEKIQHRKFINYVGRALSNKPNKEQKEICTFIDSLKSFLHASGFTLSSAAHIGVGLIRAANDGDFVGISENTTDIIFKASELVEELRYDDRCG